jgi:hypothetical protein
MEMSAQRIFGLKEFADTLIGADRAAVKSLVVYFFSDMVFTRCYKKSDTYHLQPIFCVATNGVSVVKTYKLVDMKVRFGDEFGIRFAQSRSRKLIPEAVVNALRIDVSDTLEYRGIEYYNTKTFKPTDSVKCVSILTDKLHPTADVFRLLPKAESAEMVPEMFGVDDCV